MFEWISANLATVLVTLALIAIVGLIVYKMVKDKKSGKSCGCGCGCSGCALSDKCNSGKNQNK